MDEAGPSADRSRDGGLTTPEAPPQRASGAGQARTPEAPADTENGSRRSWSGHGGVTGEAFTHRLAGFALGVVAIPIGAAVIGLGLLALAAALPVLPFYGFARPEALVKAFAAESDTDGGPR